MKKAIFVSKVANLEGYKIEMEATKIFPTRPTEYKVIKEVKVSEEEYKKLTNNFFTGWDWLPETSHVNGIANCVRINKKLLVMSEGYGYARYIALEGKGA